MNYDQVFANLVQRIKEDKTFPMPYKNYVLSDLQRLHMLVRGALSTTNLAPPVGEPLTLNRDTAGKVCNCPTGGRRTDCPVHGDT